MNLSIYFIKLIILKYSTIKLAITKSSSFKLTEKSFKSMASNISIFSTK